EVALDRGEEVVERLRRRGRAGDAERGVELIDIAIGRDAGMVLRHAPAAEEGGLACVAGLCVDAHGSRVSGLGSRVAGRGSRVSGRGSRVAGRGLRMWVEVEGGVRIGWNTMLNTTM